MLYSVRGKFANGFTFSVNPVDAPSPQDALSLVQGSEEIRTYGHAIVQVAVKTLSGKNKKIKISSKPAKERVGGGRKKKSEASAPEAPPATAKNASGGKKK